MARQAREKSGTGVYAVILRANGEIFGSKKTRELLCGTAEKYLGDGLMGIRLTPNEAHMLVRESEKGISADMKPLTTSFARTYNKLAGADGKVFAGRFGSVPVEDDKTERDCLKYLEGGKITAPYAKDTPKKPSAGKAADKPARKAEPKKPEPKKTEPKKTEPKKTEPEKAAPKKPQRKQLPSWLL